MARLFWLSGGICPGVNEGLLSLRPWVPLSGLYQDFQARVPMPNKHISAWRIRRRMLII